MAEYPTREKFYANKFIRLLTKSCAAQEIGSDACWMLTVIAMQEDVKRYRGAVTYYNGQLMPLCAFESEGRLIRARQRAVDSGWLHYEQGAKRKPGRYWTHVPETSIDIPDSPMDESDSHQIHLQIESVNGSESDIPLQIESANGNENEGKPKGNRSANGCPSILYPIPNPKTLSGDSENPELRLPHKANTVRNREWLEKWQQARKLKHGSRMSPISWEAEAMTYADWSEQRWFDSLVFSTRKASLSIIDATNDYSKPRDKNGKPKKDNQYPPMAPAKFQ